MPLPAQLPKVFLDGTQKTHDLLVMLAATLATSYRTFWADPPNQAGPLNVQSRAAGMTSEAVFDMHQRIILALFGIIPDRLAWFGAGPPIETPFLENGDIDIDALTTAWEAYQLSIAPEPEPDPEEP